MKTVLEVESLPFVRPWHTGTHARYLISHRDPKTHRVSKLLTVVSDGEGWEHVSVSVLENTGGQVRCPTWEEMCFVKGVFWHPEECVVQYHPAEQDYVNAHPFVLHMWRPTGLALPTPPSTMVGLKNSTPEIMRAFLEGIGVRP